MDKITKTHKFLYMFICILVILGAINWLFVGFFKFNLVYFFFGDWSDFIYIIVGIAGFIMLFKKIQWWSHMK